MLCSSVCVFMLPLASRSDKRSLSILCAVWLSKNSENRTTKFIGGFIQFSPWILSKINKKNYQEIQDSRWYIGLAQEVHDQQYLSMVTLPSSCGSGLLCARWKHGMASTITPFFSTISSAWNNMLFRFPNGCCSAMCIFFSHFVSLSACMSCSLWLSFCPLMILDRKDETCGR